MLADEINRAPAKVQSALLEVMAERQVSIGGQTHRVPDPFLVHGHPEPDRAEGVYPLPEAQRDRFLMKIVVGYPTDAEEREIVYRMGVEPPESARGVRHRRTDRPAAQGRPGVRAQRARRLRRSGWCWPPAPRPSTACRTWRRLIQYGASPRAWLGLVGPPARWRCCAGRDYALPQDMQDIAPDILRHRLVLSYDALADDVPADHVVRRVMSTIPLPSVAPRQHGRPATGRSAQASRCLARAACRDPAAATRQRATAATAATSPGPVLARLQLMVTRKLDGLLQGDYAGLLPGPGSEAGESREYRPGDDVRRMDWPVTARTTLPHVRRTVADRELETWLAVDLSAEPGLRHRTVAQAGRGGRRRGRPGAPDRPGRQPDRCGGRHGRPVRRGPAGGGAGRGRPPGRRTLLRLPARAGRKEAQGLFRAIAATEIRPGRSDLGALVDLLNRPPRRRGVAVVISDFLAPPQQWGRPMRKLAGPARRAGDRGGRSA